MANPEMQQKLQAKRAKMTHQERQTAALERMEELLRLCNQKLTSIVTNTAPARASRQ
jgi:hypothetical protein